jgi:hypothetical protein
VSVFEHAALNRAGAARKAAVHDGQSVLFVAEKMAALTVVHERLQAAAVLAGPDAASKVKKGD